MGMYNKVDQKLGTGLFGKGLWPVDQCVGQILYSIIKLYNLKSGLEVGAGVGYSTSFLVAGFLETAGSLVSCEYFLPKVKELESNLRKIYGIQYEQVVQIVPSDVRRLNMSVVKKKFDFVFFDQRKGDYLEHLKLILPNLKRGAFICADNVISHQIECYDFLNFVRNDTRFSTVTVKIGDGLEIVRLLSRNY